MLAKEFGEWCYTSTSRDVKTFRDRVEAEGMSFMTITLPSFGTAFEQCLDKGCVEPGDFLGFKKSSGPLPRFLGGFLAQCFDRQSGMIRVDINVDSVNAVRQLTKVFGKLELQCADHRVRAAFNKFVDIELEVQSAATSVGPSDFDRLARISTHLFGDVFSALSKEIYEGTISPRHGGGATAEKLSSNGRFKQLVWPTRLESVFPYVEYALPSSSYYHELDHVHFPDPVDERPVRVVHVTKTQKAPRIIAIEPACMQYMQQAIMRPLVNLLESEVVPGFSRINSCYSMIGFTDQDPNKELAHRGSLHGDLATLDLSDASDRVSVLHVEALLRNFPDLLEAFLAVRSTRADVPGHGVVTLSKYASMGSALCFPVEAMVFLTVVYYGIEQGLKRQLTARDIMSFAGKVRVYGDDIIVPVEYVHLVNDAMKLFGFKVNVNKSFWNGKFRESCGGDYYDGSDVTPVRVRRTFPSSRTDVQEVESIVALRNLFYLNGMWQTAMHLDKVIGKVLPYFPVVESTSAILGKWSLFFPYEKERECPRLHRPLIRGYVARYRTPRSNVNGYGALMKFFLKQGEEPYADKRHLERQGRSKSADIKLKWLTPY
jgi:hypothetical protein